ncbi:MAG: L,D-transpeptidase family protein, partial [Nevskiales bacterium]
EVPPSIAKKDKLPILKQNLAYLEEHKFDVLSGWGEDEVRVDAATLDWTQFNEGYFPYHLRQQPGPTNALGRIKFMLPNRFNIYLHDTPAKHLFDSETRTFSSGCIRLKQPLELADYILANDPRWQGKDIRQILEGEPKQILRLKNHIPVHILYFTAWAEQESAVVHFREDVYNRDINIVQALNEETTVSP